MEIEKIKAKYGFMSDAADPQLAKAAKDVRRAQVLVNNVRNDVRSGKIKVSPKIKNEIDGPSAEVYQTLLGVIGALKRALAMQK